MIATIISIITSRLGGWVVGGLLVLLIGGGLYVKYNWIDKPAYEKEIRELKEAALESRIREAKKDTELEILRQKQAVRTKVIYESKKVEEGIKSGDPARVIELFQPYRVLPKGNSPASDGKGSRSRPAPR